MLRGCRITNAVKCVPPGNKPRPEEIRNCNSYLAAELAGLRAGAVILALGAIAHDAVLAAFGLPRSKHRFAHAAEHALPNGIRMIDSYHCSRYNTQTRRLTPEMFQAVVGRATARQAPAASGDAFRRLRHRIGPIRPTPRSGCDVAHILPRDRTSVLPEGSTKANAPKGADAKLRV